MAAQVLGEPFKAVIHPLLVRAGRFGAYRQRVAHMRAEAWYPWEEFVHVARTLHHVMGDAAVDEVAQRLAAAALAGERRRGLDSLEAVLGDVDALLRQWVRDLPRAESVRTLALGEGEAVLESDSQLPASLLAGLLRGYLGALGKCIRALEVTCEGPTQRFTLRWR